VGELADALTELADDLGDRSTRQRAADRALAAARAHAGSGGPAGSTAAVTMLRIVAVDVMVFAGADPGQAAGAVHEGAGELLVAEPASPSRMPFRLKLRRSAR
jgi:hypothetical protein